MQHVYLTCRNHPDLFWHTKCIAVGPGGGYNGARNIFFAGRKDPSKNWGYSEYDPETGFSRECPCSGDDLECVETPETLEAIHRQHGLYVSDWDRKRST